MVHRRAAVAVILATLSLAAVRGDDSPPNPLATSDDVKKMVQDGKYRDALKDLLRILALKGPAAAAYDRYDMLMLKAESQLQVKQRDGAILTYQQARDEAMTEKKPERLVMPTAMLELAGHSPTYEYRPKAAGAQPMSILDREKRPQAFGELLDDELPPVKAKMPALAKVTSMGPVQDAAKVVGILRAVEIAGSGDSAETGELVRQVMDDAHRLMEPAMEDMQGHTDLIAKHAEELVTENMPQVDMNSGKSWLQQVTHKRGPNGDERRSLEQIEATCGKMSTAARQLAASLGTEFDAMEDVAVKAEALRKQAAAILAVDYTVPVKK